MQLEIQQLSKRLGDREVLSQVSLIVDSAAPVLIFGLSGVGKTTLASTIAGRFNPDSGEILLNGVDISRQRPYERRVALMGQRETLEPGLTVFGNVVLSALRQLHHRQEIAWPLLQEVFGFRASVKEKAKAIALNALARAEVPPELMYRRADSTLSGGERRRVELARVFATAPELVILDEPTTGLDSLRRKQVMAEVSCLCHGDRLVLIITHDIYALHALTQAKVAIMQESGVSMLSSERVAVIRHMHREEAEAAMIAEISGPR